MTLPHRTTHCMLTFTDVYSSNYCTIVCFANQVASQMKKLLEYEKDAKHEYKEYQVCVNIDVTCYFLS